jgi:hypothetical protein
MEGAVEKEPRDPEQNVNRRQALKKMAAVGGAVWVAPALQTINMARAKAGTPREVCFSVLITAGNKCEEPGPSGQGFHCIVPVLGTGGCSHITPIATHGGSSWVVNLGCRWVEGAVKSGGGTGSCCTLPIAPGTTGTITIPRCATGPHGQLQDISGVEITFCCDVP